MKRALWSILTLILLIACLLAIPFGLASADSASELVLLDGGAPVDGVTVTTYSVSGRTYTCYRLPYHEGLALTVDDKTEKGVAIGQPELKAAVFDNKGMPSQQPAISGISSAGMYVFTGVVGGAEQVTVVIDVVPIDIEDKLEWVDGTLFGEYGQTPHPQAIVDGLDADVQLTYTTTYKPLDAPGEYAVTAEAIGNYQGSIGGTLVISKCQAAITVSNPPEESVEWDGPYDAIARLGVTVDAKYDLLADKILLLLDGKSVPSGTIDTVGDHTLAFRLAGDNNYYLGDEGNKTDSYDLTITRSPLAIDCPLGSISVQYDEGGAYAASIYQAVKLVSHDKDVELDKTILDIVYVVGEGESVSAPSDHGEYHVKLSYRQTDYYLAAEQVILPFVIRQKDISSALTITLNGSKTNKTNVREFAYGQSFTYAYSLEGYEELADKLSATYLQKDGLGWAPMGDKPSNPGTYRYHVGLDYGNYAIDDYREFSIQRAALQVMPLSQLVEGTDEEGKLHFTYGEPIEIHPDVPDYEEDGQWVITFKKGAVAVPAPTDAGTYNVQLTLADDSFYTYTQLFAAGVVIDPKEIDVTVLNKPVTYGSEWQSVPLNPKVGDPKQDVSFAEGAVKQEDLADLLSNLKLVAVGQDSRLYEAPDRSMVVGTRFALQVEGTHPNYIIHSVDGELIISQRTLTVTADDLTIYRDSIEKALTVTLGNACKWDDQSALVACFQVQITDGASVLTWAQAVESVTTYQKVYDLVVHTTGDSPLLNNYNPRFVGGKLTIRPTSLVTNLPSEFGVAGRFSQEDSLMLTKGSVASYQSAVSSKLKGYTAKTVYEIAETVATQGGTGITVSIAAPKDAKLLVSYDGGETYEVEEDFVYQDGKIVLSQTVMASRYIVCVKRDIPWLLIGAVGGGVVGIVLIVLIVVMTMKWKKDKKKKEEMLAVSAAPSAAAAKRKSEDEELDELIQNFDESTVKHELTPAERIALREKEEKYNQYRLRLQRMRGSGDKAIQDKLSSLQLGSENDDDVIIARMIQEDEQRAKELEEEILREQEEEAAKSATKILEHKNVELKQRSFAPTAKADDDDDFDI